MAYTETLPEKRLGVVARLFNRPFAAVCLSHFMTDLYVGQRSVFLAFVATSLGMSNATLGLVTTIAVMAAGLTQPLFGYLSDRIGSNRLIIGAMIWTVSMFALSVLLPIETAPVLVVLANLGAGAYHPSGAMQATRIGRARMDGKDTTALSFFFLFGQFGFFFGPLLGGELLGKLGERGLIILAVVGLPVIILISRWLRGIPMLVPETQPAPQKVVAEPPANRRTMGLGAVALFAIIAFQAWTQQNITTFMPKFVADIQQPAEVYGRLAALFIGGTAVGNLIGGYLADRIGKKVVILTSMALAGVPLFLLGYIGYSPVWYLLLFLAGAFVGAAYSVLVSLGQQFAPGNGALASGLVLGFVFSSGALGGLLTGLIADRWGFEPVFYLSAALAVSAAFLTPLIDVRQRKS